MAGWLEACVAALRTADLAAGRFDFWSLNSIPPAAPVRAATRQLGFLPAGLGANLAVRRGPFDEVGGFDEYLVPGEDIDLCWRLQLRGFSFADAAGAVVAKRARSDFRGAFRQAYAYGKSGPLLHKRFRRAGARRDVAGCPEGVGLARRVGLPHRPADPAHRVGTGCGHPVGAPRGVPPAPRVLPVTAPTPTGGDREGQPTFQSAPT